MKTLKHFFITILLYFQTSTGMNADLLIFSFDRPLQLYALLESIEKYVTGINEIVVLLRTSDQNFLNAYMKVNQRFSKVKFVQQCSINPRNDFKEKVINVLDSFRNPCLLFAVDDNIVTDYIDISYCIDLLEQNSGYGFYLRMGKNIDYFYLLNKPLIIPKGIDLPDGIFIWKFKTADCLNYPNDWAYPNSLDMVLYRKKDVLDIIKTLNFNSPNTLEGQWHRCANMENRGICFEKSKIVNIPLNSVQQDFTLANMNYASTRQLLDIFNNNYKIDITPLHNIKNRSGHMEYIPSFVER